MDDLLFLAHRIPWPPNKGDKIRSYHLLRYLAARYRVHVGTFIDDPADEEWVGDLRSVCASVYVARLHPRTARIKALSGLISGEALTLPYYRHRGLARWVADTVSRHEVSRAVVFSSAMAQYVEGFPSLRSVIDLVDVDSDKWRQYAEQKRWPWTWLYGREAARLHAFERKAVDGAAAALLVSPEEVALFNRLAPGYASRVHAVCNGVDSAFFDPGQAFSNPYPDECVPLVFTGAMDYWPNEDAVQWFVQDVFPAIRSAIPHAAFYIVGNRPSEAVRRLEQHDGVIVTGFVDDVRPYLAHARAVVAPLRVARGVQNKVLEAMAMARPVLLTPAAMEGIDADPQREVLLCEAVDAFPERLQEVLAGQHNSIGRQARQRVLADFSWESNLAGVGALLEGEAPAASVMEPLVQEGEAG